MFAMFERTKKWTQSAHVRWAGGTGTAAILALATRHGNGAWLDPTVCGALLLGLGAIAATLYARRAATPDWEANRPAEPAPPWPMTGFLLGILLLYAGSSAITDNWFFPTNWKISGAAGTLVLKSGYFRSLILTLALALGFKPLLRTPRALALAWVFGAGLAVHQLYSATGFGMIYRVDSPAFVYRFWSFQHLFPRPDGYDTIRTGTRACR